MRTSTIVPALVAFVLVSLCAAGGSTIAISAQSIDAPAANSTVDQAIRVDPAELTLDPAELTLDPAHREVAVVGDSVLADLSTHGASPNDIVVFVHDALRGRGETAHIVVRNLAVPGLATLFPAGPGFGTLDSHLQSIFPEHAQLPDVVIIAVSSVDLNAHPDVPVAELGPSIISELDRIARHLFDRGADTVFVPTFGANSELFNQLKNSLQPTFRDYMLNARIEQLNRLLVASELPLLFDRFRQLDTDGDGSADRAYFVGRDGPGEFDDGVHPNALGQRLYASNLIDALAAAFERG